MKITKQDKSATPKVSRRPPATDPKDRENQLINLAVGVAEQQLIDGTASAQVITHFLKLATEKEKLEQQKLRGENALLQGKVDQLASQVKSEDLYKRALKAMRAYSGQDSEDDLDDGNFDDDGTDAY